MAKMFVKNGTSTAQIKKRYAKNGTSAKQVKKRYAINGTSAKLVYSAEYVFFPNADTSNINNWSYTGSFGVTEDGITCYFSSAGSGGSIGDYPVDFTPYKKLYIIIASVNGDGDHNFNIRWRRKSDNVIATAIEVEELDASERVKTHELNISSINETCYLAINGDHGGGGKITRIWFEE